MRKVLIIEDEQNIRETLADLLGIHGYDVLLAADGATGIHKAIHESPNVILCDVNMPHTDGYQVLSELRKTGSLTLVPFIFLTAKSSMEELRTGMELGADDYLTKPFSHETLVRTIKIAEEKKLAQINQLNGLQHQLNLEKLKIREVDHLNSHEIRRKLSIIQSLFPLIKSGELSFDEGMKILEDSGAHLDLTVHQISEIISEQSTTENGGKTDVLGQVKTIWLVDDDATQNLLTKMLLLKVNPEWKIRNFLYPEKALQELTSGPPDLIFLDINMPHMDGFGFLKELSKQKINLKVIMLSSSISQADIHRSLSYSHVISYLTKPLKKDRITALFS